MQRGVRGTKQLRQLGEKKGDAKKKEVGGGGEELWQTSCSRGNIPLYRFAHGGRVVVSYRNHGLSTQPWEPREQLSNTN